MVTSSFGFTWGVIGRLVVTSTSVSSGRLEPVDGVGLPVATSPPGGSGGLGPGGVIRGLGATSSPGGGVPTTGVRESRRLGPVRGGVFILKYENAA